MKQHKKSKIMNYIVKDWYALTMIIISYAFAIIMLLQPFIFHKLSLERIHSLPSQLFDPVITGLCLIIFASVKLLGQILKNKSIRLLGLMALNIVWAITAVSLFYRFLHGSQSATFLLSFAMVLIGFGQALRGDYGQRLH
ncbi:hypothetical protein HMPREF9318_00104 [Streptococcus urinalis FB127-CNA-2]|nr:hypothetical protein HMPREF9318_00104 [Streptococcus urinalis FB127-CNA-2]VEF31719.1 Uncharacterised protein [Streptococcus urinalis]